MENLKPLKRINYINMIPRKTLIVLGMPRSFSSMTTGGLQQMGVNIGNRLIGADNSNPSGHFENKDFVEMNKRIFNWAKTDWMNPPSREKILQFPDKKLIKKVVENNQDDLWGWKDPRTAITIDLYLPYLNNPIFIVCYRNFEDIAKSLLVRDKTPLEKGRKIAEEYYNRIQDFLKRYYESKSI